MFIHTKERPHKCEFFKMTFARQNYLRGHMVIQTKIRPHKCDICKITFAWKDYLKIHMLVDCSYKRETTQMLHLQNYIFHGKII